jgi:hypothetical protein
MGTYEMIEKLIADYGDTPALDIPKTRIDEIDWLGYGWPIIDIYGDLVSYGFAEEIEELNGARFTFVVDESGTQWLLRDYPDDGDPLEIPDGFRIDRYMQD